MKQIINRLCKSAVLNLFVSKASRVQKKIPGTPHIRYSIPCVFATMISTVIAFKESMFAVASAIILLVNYY